MAGLDRRRPEAEDGGRNWKLELRGAFFTYACGRTLGRLTRKYARKCADTKINLIYLLLYFPILFLPKILPYFINKTNIFIKTSQELHPQSRRIPTYTICVENSPSICVSSFCSNFILYRTDKITK